MEFDPDRIYQQLVQSGEDWADKEAAAELLEETKKTVMAQQCSLAPSNTSAERERWALCRDEYKSHVKNMVLARQEANRARVRYDSMKVLAEMRRTESANRRAEMNLR